MIGKDYYTFKHYLGLATARPNMLLFHLQDGELGFLDFHSPTEVLCNRSGDLAVLPLDELFVPVITYQSSL